MAYSGTNYVKPDGLKNRLLRVAFHTNPVPTSGQFSNPFDASNGALIFDETSNIRVRVHKDTLSLQNQATIEIGSIIPALRQMLTSQFSAWQQNQRLVNGVQQPFMDVYIAAGYEWTENGVKKNNLSQVYHGQVTLVDQTGVPPNITTRIIAYTHQVDKTKFVVMDGQPFTQTYKQWVMFAGNQMGFDNAHIVCETSYDDQIVTNMFRSRVTVASLLPALQDGYHSPQVAAYIDDDFLIVTDLDKAINLNDVVTLTEFIGTPHITEWGAEGTVFVDPAIRLGGVANFVSTQLPGINGQYIIMSLDYWLAPRETPFYVTVSGSPF